MTLPPRSAWRRLEREPAARSAFSFLGRAYFSEWSLLSTFPGFLPLFRSFYSLCSLSCSFFFLKGIQRLMLCGFRSQIRGLTLQETRCAIRGMGETEDWSQKPPEERPRCTTCGKPLWARGEQTRFLQTTGGEAVKLTRSYGTCPQCGRGFFPPG